MKSYEVEMEKKKEMMEYILRIAQALEKMAENNDMLMRDRDHLRESLQDEKANTLELGRQVWSLKMKLEDIRLRRKKTLQRRKKEKRNA